MKLESALILTIALAFSCSPEDGSGSPAEELSSTGAGGRSPAQILMDAMAAGMSGAGGASTGNSGPRTCKSAAADAVMTISGTACGVELGYATPVGSVIRLGQRDFLTPVEEITAFSVGDFTAGESPLDDGYFDTHDVVLSLGLVAGPLYEAGTGTHEILYGTLDICGVGRFVFEQGLTLDLTISEIDNSSIQAQITNAPVIGMSDQVGADQVDACSGSLTIDVSGDWQRSGL